jgi:hypothetical protein
LRFPRFKTFRGFDIGEKLWVEKLVKTKADTSIHIEE